MLEDLRASAPEGVHVLGRVDENEKVERMARAHVHVATSKTGQPRDVRLAALVASLRTAGYPVTQVELG